MDTIVSIKSKLIIFSFFSC